MKYYPMKLVDTYSSRLEAVMSLGSDEADAQLKIIQSDMNRSESIVIEKETADGELFRFAIVPTPDGAATVWVGRSEIAFDDRDECMVAATKVSKKFKRDKFAVISSTDPVSKERH